MSSASEIANKIFGNSLKKPGEISLNIDEDMDLKEVFEMLLMIFTEGMKILYGDSNDKVDLGRLTPNDFEKVNKYFQSFGYECNYKIYQPHEINKINFETRKYTNQKITNSTKLEMLRLPLKCGNNVYEISFKFASL